MLKLCQLTLALSVVWVMFITAALLLDVLLIATLPLLTLAPLGRALAAGAAAKPTEAVNEAVKKVRATAAKAALSAPVKLLIAPLTTDRTPEPLAVFPWPTVCSPTATNAPRRLEKTIL
jgi:hypothetical protein